MKYIVKAPLHVSGLWIPVLKNSIHESGSLGAGLNLSLYLIVKDYSVGDDCEIIINAQPVLLDHAKFVCGKTGLTLKAMFESPMDLGKGYAVSAAAVLAYSVLSGLLRGNGFIEDYASYAHEAEIKYRTGLGDVLAIYYGGAEVRVKPGAPGIGVVKHIVVKDRPCIIACILSGDEDTPSMLKRITSETYSYGRELLREVMEKPVLEVFFEKAQLFTRRIFNYDQVDRMLSGIKDRLIGYYRKKQALIIWVEKGYEEDVISYLARYRLYCLKTSIDFNGVTIDYST